MYIKKILLFLVFAGLIAGGLFAYMVYGAFFTPNTKFNNDEAYVFVKSDHSFEEVKKSLSPLLEDMETFEQAAERKGYSENIRGGKYAIRKGMNNNDIINSLRSNNIPVKVAFNNQESLE
ncbi:MAG: endolytic transglycosylase MltG, partial [Aurantibacter sp.]